MAFITLAHGFVYLDGILHRSWKFFKDSSHQFKCSNHQPRIQSTTSYLYLASMEVIETETKLCSKIETKLRLKREITHRIRHGLQEQVRLFVLPSFWSSSSPLIWFVLWRICFLLRMLDEPPLMNPSWLMLGVVPSFFYFRWWTTECRIYWIFSSVKKWTKNGSRNLLCVFGGWKCELEIFFAETESLSVKGWEVRTWSLEGIFWYEDESPSQTIKVCTYRLWFCFETHTKCNRN